MPAREQAEPIDFDIPAGSLATALIEIGRTSQTIVSFNPELVKKFTVNGVRGRYTLAQVLALVIDGSALHVEVTPGGTVTVQPRSASDVHATGRGADALPATNAGGLVGPVPPPRVVLEATTVRPAASPGQDVGLKASVSSGATRDSTPLSELPQAVSVITAEALTSQEAVTQMDALRYVTGTGSMIEATSRSVLPSSTVRGFPAQYAVSGIRTIRGEVPFDTAVIERMEVIKGPSGVVGGIATIGGRGGVIDVTLKRPVPGASYEASAGMSSRDGGTWRNTVDMRDGNDSGSLWRLVGYASGTGTTDGGYSDAYSRGLLAAVRHQNADFDVTLAAHGDWRRDTAPRVTQPNKSSVADYSGGFAGGNLKPIDPHDRERSQYADVELDAMWKFAPGWHTRFKARTERVRRDARQHLFRDDTTGSAVEYAVQLSSGRQTAVQWALQGKLQTGPLAHSLTLGVEMERWRWTDAAGSRMWNFDEDTFVPGETPLPEPPFEDTLYLLDEPEESSVVHKGYFLQDQIRLGPLSLRLAARRGKFAERYLSMLMQDARGLNWDAGASYRLSSWVSLYAGAQSAIEADFRSGQEEVAGDSVVPYQELRQSQAGLKFDLLGERLALTLEGYRVLQKNSLGYSAEESNPTFLMPGVTTRGVEIELSGRVLPSVDVLLGLDVVHSDQTRTGSDLAPTFKAGETYTVPTPGVSRRSMRLLANWRLPQRLASRTQLGLGFRAYSYSWASTPDAEYNDEGQRIPGGAQLDLFWKRSFSNWSLSASMFNVFDRRLFLVSSNPDFVPLLPGRSVGVTISYTP